MTLRGQHTRVACVILILVAGAHAHAQAQTSASVAVLDAIPLVPTRSEEQTRRANAIARELSASIESMPGVRAARVHIALPVAPDFAKSLASAPRASVLVTPASAHAQLDVAGIQRLVAGAVPGLDVSAVSVVATAYVSREPDAPRWSQVGPWSVAPGSASTLREALIALLVLQLVLAVTLVAVMTRERRRRLAAADGG